MDLLAAPPDPADPARLVLEAGRTCDRLRSMSLVRLSAELPGGGTRAGAAFDLAGEFADLAADLAEQPRRDLPPLPDPAAGDVLAVCARDLVQELLDRPGEPDAAEVCARAVAALVSLRRVL